MLDRQVHYQTNRKFLLAIGSSLAVGSFLLFAGFGILLLTRSVTSATLPLSLTAFLSLFQPLLPILFVIGIFFLGMADTKIITSSEGMELHQFGFCTKSRWGNVARIAPFQSGQVSAYAIYFYQPARQFFKILPSMPITSVKMIPLYLFRFDRDSELGRALRLNKPDLFD